LLPVWEMLNQFLYTLGETGINLLGIGGIVGVGYGFFRFLKYAAETIASLGKSE